jgi:hypothetical protein
MVNIFMDHMIVSIGDYIIELSKVVTLYIIFYETYEKKVLLVCSEGTKYLKKIVLKLSTSKITIDVLLLLLIF